MNVFNHKQRTASENSFSQSYLQEKVQKGFTASLANSTLSWIPCEIEQPEFVLITVRNNLEVVRANVLGATPTADDFPLDSGASGSDDTYNDMIIKIDGKPSKVIADYDAADHAAGSKVCITTETDLLAAPAVGTPYTIWRETPTGTITSVDVRLILEPIEALTAHAETTYYPEGWITKATPTGGSLGAYVCITPHTSTAGPDFDTDIGNWQALPTSLPGFLKVTHTAGGSGKYVGLSYRIYGIDNQ
jgi:hypothetical protein